MVKRDECLSKSTLITLAKVNFTLLINGGRRASGREAARRRERRGPMPNGFLRIEIDCLLDK